jgi:hypothetical protein
VFPLRAARSSSDARRQRSACPSSPDERRIAQPIAESPHVDDQPPTSRRASLWTSRHAGMSWVRVRAGLGKPHSSRETFRAGEGSRALPEPARGRRESTRRCDRHARTRSHPRQHNATQKTHQRQPTKVLARFSHSGGIRTPRPHRTAPQYPRQGPAPNPTRDLLFAKLAHQVLADALIATGGKRVARAELELAPGGQKQLSVTGRLRHLRCRSTSRPARWLFRDGLAGSRNRRRGLVYRRCSRHGRRGQAGCQHHRILWLSDSPVFVREPPGRAGVYITGSSTPPCRLPARHRRAPGLRAASDVPRARCESERPRRRSEPTPDLLAECLAMRRLELAKVGPR